MLSSVAGELDFIEELRLRRWARQHYVTRSQREVAWHPVILDEMDRKDLEMNEVDEVVERAPPHGPSPEAVGIGIGIGLGMGMGGRGGGGMGRGGGDYNRGTGY